MRKAKVGPDLRAKDISTASPNCAASPSTPKNVSVRYAIQSFLRKGDDTTYKLIHQTLQKEPLNDDLLIKWLHQFSECIPILDNRTGVLITDSLGVPWQKGSKAVKELFRSVMLTLVTTHNYHAYRIIRELLKSLVPGIESSGCKDLDSHPLHLSSEAKIEFDEVCQLITEICLKVPMVSNEVLRLATQLRPYYKRPAYVHVIYVYNLLQLSRMMPVQRRDFLQVIVEDMICLDLHSPKEELLLLAEEEAPEDDDSIFEMEIEDHKNEDGNNKKPTKETKPNSLDSLMCLMLRYIHNTVHGVQSISSLLEEPAKVKRQRCPVGSVLKVGNYTRGCLCNKEQHDRDAAKKLYEDLRHIFGEVVLTTKSISHVQFLMFYLLSIRPSLTIDFIEFLKVQSFGPYPLDMRCTAIAYTASLICRASFITYEVLHSCMQVLREWCSLYMQKNQSYEGQSHILFYYVCQTLMYAFTFNYKEYTKNAARLKDSQSLLLDSLVHSRLNPIRHCTPSIASHFAAISNHFQVAYCYTLLEDAKRKRLPEASSEKESYVPLEVFLQPYFPFDPYLLPRSKEFISGHYKEFDGMPSDLQEHTLEQDEDDEDNCDWSDMKSDPISSQLRSLSGMSLETYSLS